jgi:hypothetical protein
MNNTDLKTMISAYAECALWSSTHFESEDDNCGIPFGQIDAELSEKCLEQFRADCADFLAICEAEGIDMSDLDAAQVGHDFWLTRNRHGAGFWDRGLGELGDKLTVWAHAAGSCDLYLSDSGEIECH